CMGIGDTYPQLEAARMRSLVWAALAAAACTPGDKPGAGAPAGPARKYAGTWEGRAFHSEADTGTPFRIASSVAEDGSLRGTLTFPQVPEPPIPVRPRRPDRPPGRVRRGPDSQSGPLWLARQPRPRHPRVRASGVRHVRRVHRLPRRHPDATPHARDLCGVLLASRRSPRRHGGPVVGRPEPLERRGLRAGRPRRRAAPGGRRRARLELSARPA